MKQLFAFFILIVTSSAQASLDSFITYSFAENNTNHNEIITSSVDFTWGQIPQNLDHFSRSSKSFNQVNKIKLCIFF